MILLIPAYEPGRRLVTLLDEVRAAAPDVRIVVVDDGSGPAYGPVFDVARSRGCTVLTEDVNRGKGHALKAGFQYVLDSCPRHDVVCADSDGQHSVVDILRVAAAVRDTDATVLGVREFSGVVPLRSRLGNSLTTALFAVSTRQTVRDTQTGLRAYPHSMLPWLLQVPGERFEYELSILLRAARESLPIRQVPIATIYLDGNTSSHFRPVIDSARIYLPLLAFSASSLLAFCVDVIALLALQAMLGALLPALVLARLLSSVVNFSVNHRVVFAGDSSRPLRAAAARYWGLVSALLAVNYGLLTVQTRAGVPLLPAKLATEMVLFVASYLIQRHHVFTSRSTTGQVTSAASEPHRSHTAPPG